MNRASRVKDPQTMSITKIPPAPPASQIQLPDHEQQWLDSLNLSHATNVDRHGAYQLLNSEKIGIPYKEGAVFRAYNTGDIASAFVSGRALASEYDVVRWALTRKYTSRERDRKRFGA
jgi:hypothetical protein